MRENSIFLVVSVYFCLGKNYLTLIENRNISLDARGLYAYNSNAPRAWVRQVADKKFAARVDPLLSIVDGKFWQEISRDKKRTSSSSYRANGARHERGRTRSVRHNTRGHRSSEDHLVLGLDAAGSELPLVFRCARITIVVSREKTMKQKLSTLPPCPETWEWFECKYEKKRFLTFPDRVVGVRSLRQR